MHGQLYHWHSLIISPLHGHGEVANENPLILPRTLSIVGALVLLKRRAGKKMRAPLLGLPKSIYLIMYASKRVVSIAIKYLWYSGNISVVTTGECGSQTLPQKALFLKQSMFISFREEVYFIPPYLSSDRICWNLFWVRNRTHPQTPPKLSSLEWIKFQPLENKDKRKLVVWRKLFTFGDRNMSYLASWW